MEIDQSLLDKLPPTYKGAVECLMKEYEEARQAGAPPNHLKELLWNFMNKFTALPQIWRLWKQHASINAEADADVDYETQAQVMASCFLHFFDGNDSPLLQNIGPFPFMFTKLLHGKVFSLSDIHKEHHLAIQFVKHLMTFPNEKLFKPADKKKSLWTCVDLYEEISCEPMTKDLKETYQKSVELYEKIEAVKENDEKWFDLVKSVDDVGFVMQNAQVRISEKPWNKEMWRLLMNYLEEKDERDLLMDVYAKYCKFFIENLEMRKRYLAETSKVEPSNPSFGFRKYDSALFQIYGECEADPRTLTPKDFYENLKPHCPLLQKFQDAVIARSPRAEWATIRLPFPGYREAVPFGVSIQQEFSLPLSLIATILDNANPAMLRKLYACAKQLYTMKKVAVCHKLVIGPRMHLHSSHAPKSYQHAFYLSPDDISFGTAKRIQLVNSLTISKTHCHSCQDEQSPIIFSSLISKISKCFIRFLDLDSQNLSLGELEFLSEHVERAKFLAVTIKDANDSVVSMVDMIAKMPKLYHFEVEEMTDIPFSSEFSVIEERQTKIQNFVCFGMHAEISSNIFLDFLRKSAVVKPFVIIVFFSEVISPEAVETFYVAIQEGAEHIELQLGYAN